MGAAVQAGIIVGTIDLILFRRNALSLGVETMGIQTTIINRNAYPGKTIKFFLQGQIFKIRLKFMFYKGETLQKIIKV